MFLMIWRFRMMTTGICPAGLVQQCLLTKYANSSGSSERSAAIIFPFRWLIEVVPGMGRPTAIGAVARQKFTPSSTAQQSR
jgi:hypothetical protein